MFPEEIAITRETLKRLTKDSKAMGERLETNETVGRDFTNVCMSVFAKMNSRLERIEEKLNLKENQNDPT